MILHTWQPRLQLGLSWEIPYVSGREATGPTPPSQIDLIRMFPCLYFH